MTRLQLEKHFPPGTKLGYSLRRLIANTARMGEPCERRIYACDWECTPSGDGKKAGVRAIYAIGNQESVPRPIRYDPVAYKAARSAARRAAQQEWQETRQTHNVRAIPNSVFSLGAM